MQIESQHEKRFKKFNRSSWLLFVGGLLLLLIGIYRKFFLDATEGINLKTQLPTIVDGSLRIVIGAGLLIIGLYRILKKKKVFMQKIDLEQKSLKAELKTYGIKKKRKR